MNKKALILTSTIALVALALTGCTTAKTVEPTSKPVETVAPVSTVSFAEVVKATDAKALSDSMTAAGKSSSNKSTVVSSYWSKSPFILSSVVSKTGDNTYPALNEDDYNSIWQDVKNMFNLKKGEYAWSGFVVDGSKGNENGDKVIDIKDTATSGSITRVVTWDSTKKVKPMSTLTVTFDKDKIATGASLKYSWNAEYWEGCSYFPASLACIDEAKFTYGEEVAKSSFAIGLKNVEKDVFTGKAFNTETKANFENILKVLKTTYKKMLSEGASNGDTSYDSKLQMMVMSDGTKLEPYDILGDILTTHVIDHTDGSTQSIFNTFKVTANGFELSVEDSGSYSNVTTITVKDGLIVKVEHAADSENDLEASSVVIIYGKK